MSDAPDATSDATAEQPTETQHVERTDIGVSITVQLKRGTGTLDDACADMDVLREYLHQLAEDARQIQPKGETK